jgi:hypothetical protein
MDVDIFDGMSMNIEYVAELFRALMITSICLINRKGLMFIRILSSFVAFIICFRQLAIRF